MNISFSIDDLKGVFLLSQNFGKQIAWGIILANLFRALRNIPPKAVLRTNIYPKNKITKYF